MNPTRALLASLLLTGTALAQTERPVQGWSLVAAASVTTGAETLSRVGFNSRNWTPAVVPGTVLTSLVRAGKYPEPLYGLNNLGIPESLARASYWYRTEFAVPRNALEKRTWLRFDGVNYAAEVWINGHALGTIRGAFVRGLFDVTPWVRPGGRAAVAVKILPPAHPHVPHEQTLAGGTGRNGGEMGADGATFVATIGWDWIPGIRDRNVGLWQGVALRQTGAVTIADPFIRTDLPLPRLDSARISLSTELRNATDAPQSGNLGGQIDGTNLRFRLPATLAPGEIKTVVVPDLTLARPKLWWPNGYGRPDLYRLKLRFVQGRAESDASTTVFGVRELSFFKPGEESRTDAKMTIHVNGVPILCRGGNWGMDEAMKRSPDSRIDAQVRLHRDANCNMIRNWVGQSTQENLYAACDKYGILVWDDFWLANPSDGPEPLENALFLANAREKVLRFRNHPSIALWCGRNEGFPPQILDEGLAGITRELDGTRFYQSHSSETRGVSGGGPYGQVPFERYFTVGDAFHTELGAPSIPTLESIKGMMPPSDWWPIDDDWAYHDLTRGAQAGDRYEAALSRRYGRVAGFKDFVRKGAMLTYETYRAIFEGRNARLFAPASGTLLWMSNPAQPSFVWQLYHHDLDPTAAMFASKKANERVHVQMSPDLETQIVNTTPVAIRGARLQYEVFVHPDAPKPFVSNAISIDVPAGGVWRRRFPPDTSVAFMYRLRLLDARGRLLSENVCWPLEHQGQTYLAALPNVALEGRVRRTRNGVSVTLRNPGKTVSLLTHLSLRRADGTRVLPAFFSDNYLHVFPGESRTIEIEGPGGTQVYVDGWNLTGVRGPGLKYNEDARPEPPLPPLPPRPVLPGTVLSVDSGGLDVPGSPWNTDEEFATGGNEAKQPGPITGSDLPPDVLETERWGEFTYAIPVKAGKYRVRLVFAETSQPRPGGRKFHVDLNRQRVLTDFEIFAEAGGANRAIVKEFDAEPDRNGNLVIAFRRGSANEPEVRAVQVLPR